MIWIEIVGQHRQPPHGARRGRHPSPMCSSFWNRAVTAIGIPSTSLMTAAVLMESSLGMWNCATQNGAAPDLPKQLTTQGLATYSQFSSHQPCHQVTRNCTTNVAKFQGSQWDNLTVLRLKTAQT